MRVYSAPAPPQGPVCHNRYCDCYLHFIQEEARHRVIYTVGEWYSNASRHLNKQSLCWML